MIDDILARIEAITDIDEARKIRNAAKARCEVIGVTMYQAALAETWERMKLWKPGIDLWCCAEGTFIGGSIQRGDKLRLMKVYRGHTPERRGAWLKIGKAQSQWWRISDVHRYNLRTVKPEKPIDPIERKMIDGVAKVIERIEGGA